MPKNDKPLSVNLHSTNQIIIATAVVTATVMVTKGTMDVAGDLIKTPIRKLTAKLNEKSEKLSKS